MLFYKLCYSFINAILENYKEKTFSSFHFVVKIVIALGT